MKSPASAPPEHSARSAKRAAPHPYHRLKAAQALFEKPPHELSVKEGARVEEVAQRYGEIESAVLASAESAGVCIAADAIDAALAEIRARYAEESEYTQALAHNGLKPASLREALARDLHVEAVLARVGASAAPVGETEAEIFYYNHQERFRVEERRRARHILITIQDESQDNRRERVQARMDAIVGELAVLRAAVAMNGGEAKPAGLAAHPQAGAGFAERFAEFALRHSECPTALQGGVLGDLPRGKLYPELEAALFELAEGACSPPVESELGLHLLYCEQIFPAGILAYAEVKESLCRRLSEERGRKASLVWLKQLLAKQGGTAPS